MKDPVLWLIFLIPGSWLLSLAVLVRDEWRMRKRDDRGSRYP
jgi:hypothetical protein